MREDPMWLILSLIVMLNVCSYNCNSLKNSVADIKELCDKNDVIFLQETWLCKFELSMVNRIHPDFLGMGVSAVNSSNALLRGRPYGGVAILWKKVFAELCQSQSY